MALISLDDAGHEPVSDDVRGLQLDPGDPFDRPQNPLGMEQTRGLSLGQVELGRVPGDDDAGTGPHAGEEVPVAAPPNDEKQAQH